MLWPGCTRPVLESSGLYPESILEKHLYTQFTLVEMASAETSANAPVVTAPKKTIFSWALFDFANTGFYVIVITFVGPNFFIPVLAGGNEAVWGTTISVSMLLTALIGPVLGSIADASGRKKFFLGIFTALCTLATAGLFWATGPALLGMAIVLVILANVGFEGGTIFYDAFLPEIAAEKDYARVSALGWGIGYVGSFLTLAAILPILIDDPSQAEVRSTFLIAAGIFFLFSIPMFLNVRERSAPATPGRRISLGEGYSRLRETISHLRNYRQVVRFLTAFFFYNDGILTVIFMASIFMKETLGFDMQQQITFFMIVQATALLGSLLFGRITDRIGARSTILITLGIWIAVVITAYFVVDTTGFFIVGGIAGLALGSSQSTSRTYMALLTPPDRKTEFFGFYDGFFGKASAIVGPALFGFIAVALGQRPAMLIIGVMFVIGAVLLLRVADVRPERG